jgi:carbon monoxide dehydrogenase subunit G
MRFVQVVSLSAPPERVWPILADWERYPEWMPDVAWVRRTGTEEGEGMRLAVRTKVFGISLVTDELVVTTWDPPRRMGIEHRGLVHGPAEWVLEPTGGGTRFTWSEELRMPPPLLGWLALFFYSPVLRWNFRRTMQNLARRVDALPR